MGLFSHRAMVDFPGGASYESPQSRAVAISLVNNCVLRRGK
jgi:hypothetical protein